MVDWDKEEEKPTTVDWDSPSRNGVSTLGGGDEQPKEGRTIGQMANDAISSTGEALTGFATGIAQGMGAESVDELVGGAAAGAEKLVEGGDLNSLYQKNRDYVRKGFQIAKDNAPVSTVVGKIAGSLTPPGLFLRGAGMLKTGMVEAGRAATEYMGEQEEMSDVSPGAALGWGLTAAVPAEVVTGGVKAMRKLLGVKSDDQVADVIKSLVDSSGLTPDEIMKEANKLGINQASLVDSTGATGVAFGQGLAGSSGANVMQEFQKQLAKVADTKKRVKSSMENATGVDEGQYYESLDALKLNRKQRAEELYGTALDDTRFKVTPDMSRTMQRNPSVKEAWESLQVKYENRGEKLPDWYTIGEDGVVKIPDVGFNLPGRTMQEFKWELDQIARDSSIGIDAASKKMNRLVTGDRDRIMQQLYKQNPDFKKANAAYAGDTAMIEAQEMGIKHGLGGTKLSQQLKYIDGLSQTEKDAYLQGIMTNTYDAMGATRDEVLGSVNKISNANSRAVLEKLVGKDKAARIAGSISSERRFRDVEGKLTQGSQTDLRRSATESFKRMDDRAQKGVAESLTDMTSEIPFIKKWQREVRGSQELTGGMRVELAELMLKPGGVQEALDRLLKAGKTKDEASRILAVLRGLPGAGVQLGSQPEAK